MALSGSFHNYPYVSSGHNFGLLCEWSGAQNVSGNYTDVTINVYLCYRSLNVGQRTNNTVSINGTKETYTTAAINHDAGGQGKKLIKTKTTRVYHNSDGTKSCGLEATWNFNGTYNGKSISTIKASATVTLNTIPRTSSFTAGNGTLGTPQTITINKANSSFTHVLAYEIGSEKKIFANKTAESSVSWTPPLSFANYNTTGASVSVLLICDTYNGNSYIGTATKYITCAIPANVKPTINPISVILDNSANMVVSQWGIYVAGYSKARIVASASGSYGSTIKSFTISGGYNATVNGESLNYTGEAFTSSGSKIFDVEAKDSRGRLSIKASSNPITVYAYSKPTLSYFSVDRSTTSATKMIAKANWSIASVNGKNTSTATLYYKKSSASIWTTYGTIAANTSVTLNANFEEASSYNFRIIVTDSLSNKAQSEVTTGTVGVTLDFRAGGRGLGIGKMAESDNLEVGFNTIFMNNVYTQNGDGTKALLADHVVEQGVSGEWYYRKWKSGKKECWCRGKKTGVNGAATNYSGYHYSNPIRIDTPFHFTKVYAAFCDGGSFDRINSLHNMGVINTSGVGYNTFSFVVCGHESTATNIEIWYSLYVMGE